MSCSVVFQQRPLEASLSPPGGGTSGSGARLVTMERRRSVKPFRSQDEYLYAMKEDISEWFNLLYGIASTADDLLDHLETGILLCRHAEQVQQYVISSFRCDVDDVAHYNEHHQRANGRHVDGHCAARQSSADTGGGNTTGRHQSLVDVADSSMIGDRHHRSKDSDATNCGSGVLAERTCWAGLLSAASRSNAQPGSFHSRDNLCQFLAWCRRQLLIPDTLLFETDDLVLRKNERSVVLCLLEAARRAVRHYNFPSAPDLVRLEQEIDDELAQEAAPRTMVSQPPVQRARPVIKVDMMSLDEMVRDILGRCTCPDRFPMVRVSEGRYRIGDSQTMIFIRILRSHVMVRIGGGWDTLENFLDRHDPCRCQLRGHRAMSVASSMTYNGPSSSLSASRSSDRTTATPGGRDSSKTADFQVARCTSPTSLVTSVQSSGAWATPAKSVTSRTENRVGQQQQQQQQPQQRSRPKTPTGDMYQKHLPAKLTSSSNGRRTPVAMTTIDVDVTDDASDKCAITTGTAAATSRSRPRTPVNVSQNTMSVTPRTARDSVAKTTTPIQRRSKTPDIESFNNITATADHTPSTPRGRSATRTSAVESTSSVSKPRGRTTPRSSSVGRHEMTLASSADWPDVGAMQRPHKEDVPKTSSTLRRSGTSADIRSDVSKASDPSVLMISRNADGRHIVRDHVTQANGHVIATTRHQIRQQPANKNKPAQLSKQQSQQQAQEQHVTCGTSTPRSQTNSSNVRLSMTADKLLPSKLRLQQTKQNSQDGTNESDSKQSDDITTSRLDWSVNGAFAVAAPSRAPVTVAEPFVGDVTKIEQQVPVSSGNGEVRSACRISVIKRSSTETTSSAQNIGSFSTSGDVDTTRLDHVDFVVDRATPEPAKTAGRAQVDLISMADCSHNAEAVRATVTNAESLTGSDGVSPTSNVIPAEPVCSAVLRAGEFSYDRSSGDTLNCSERQQVVTQNEPSSPTMKDSTSFHTLLKSLPDLPPPEDDEEINSRMEMLFEEYRKVELGLMDLVWKANNEVDIPGENSRKSSERKAQRVNSISSSTSKTQKPNSTPRGREQVQFHETSTISSAMGEKQLPGQATSGVRRTLSRPVSAVDSTGTEMPTTPRSAGRITRSDTSSTLSALSGSARRSSSLQRGNSGAMVTQPLKTTYVSTPKSAIVSGTVITNTERVDHRFGRTVSNGSAPSAVDRRRARSCVRGSDERGDLRRAMSVTFDFGNDANDNDSNGVNDLRATDSQQVNRELETSAPAESQRLPLTPLTTGTSTPTSVTTLSLVRPRRRSYSRSTSSDDGTPTKIPMPVDTKRFLSRLTSQESFDDRLKRVDSGVDINNMI